MWSTTQSSYSHFSLKLKINQEGLKPSTLTSTKLKPILPFRCPARRTFPPISIVSKEDKQKSVDYVGSQLFSPPVGVDPHVVVGRARSLFLLPILRSRQVNVDFCPDEGTAKDRNPEGAELSSGVDVL